LISLAAGGPIGGMASDLDINELRRLELFCLEQAKLCATPEGRAGLEALAAQYRIAAEGTPRKLNRPSLTAGSGEEGAAADSRNGGPH
jgi:hypothetical protein